MVAFMNETLFDAFKLSSSHWASVGFSIVIKLPLVKSIPANSRLSFLYISVELGCLKAILTRLSSMTDKRLASTQGFVQWDMIILSGDTDA